MLDSKHRLCPDGLSLIFHTCSLAQIADVTGMQLAGHYFAGADKVTFVNITDSKDFPLGFSQRPDC